MTARRFLYLVWALFFPMLAGCAVFQAKTDDFLPTRTMLESFSLEGRFSLRHEDQNYSGHLSWQHLDANNTLLLSSPLRQGIAQITTDATGARLVTSDGRIYRSANIETLTREVLGFPLPLAQLVDWVRGWSRGEGIYEYDSKGRVKSLRHEAWTIRYSYDNDDQEAPPGRVFAEKTGGFALRLRIDAWGLPENGSTQGGADCMAID